MLEVRNNDFTENFSKLFDMVEKNEEVSFLRPHNKNIVILSEKRYNELEKSERNLAYFTKLNKSIQEANEGKVVKYTREQMRAMETD